MTKVQRIALYLLSFCIFASPAPAKKIYTIGSIQIIDHPDLNNTLAGFKEALKEVGLMEGERVRFIVNKNSQGGIDGVKSAIAEFIKKKVDLIFAITSPCAMTAVKSTSTIPIVFAAVRDPVKLGIVKSLSKPGGNATGVIILYPIYNLLKIAKDILPAMKKMTLIEDKHKALKADMRQDLTKKAKEAGIDLEVIYISSKDEIKSLLSSLKGKTDCIVVNNNMEVIGAMNDLITAALANKIPLITTNEPSVEKGALATLAVDYFKEGKKAGRMAAEVLAGTPPKNIPVEKPSFYRLVINLKTATALGLKVPSSLKEAADRLIK